MTKTLLTIVAGGFLLTSGLTAHGSLFNVNDAFVANENPGPPANPNGPYTYGYTFDPTTPASISTAGLVHTGPTGFNNTDPGVQGFYFPNNVLVPAVLGNITNAPIATNFGVTLKPGELLLHPGSPTPNGFAQPAADGDIQYVVPSAGTYTISGSFEALNVGGTGISVYVNGVQKFNAQDGAQGTITPFSVTQALNPGDTVAFVVDQGTDGTIGSDSTGLYANIQTPEPTSIALLGFGALGILIRRRRA